MHICYTWLYWSSFQLSQSLSIALWNHLCYQSLEFITETRILVEMKIENRKGGEFFREGKKIDKHTFFYESEDDGSVIANWRYKNDIHYEF